MKAVVMAGGEGSRLRPVTCNVPKPLVPICNEPIMSQILRLVKRHGINDVVATLHYLADEIRSLFGDGEDFGVNLQYSVETSPLGTAGSVKKAEQWLKDDSFLIISGDALTDCNLSRAIEFHKEKKALATLILYRVPNPLEFGVVITDKEGRVVRFQEKPSWSEVFSDTVNTGMYILEPEILDMMEPGKAYDWSSDIFPKLLEQGAPMYGYIMPEYWCDVGNLSQYREAQEHLLAGRMDLSIQGQPSMQSESGIYIGPNASVEDTVTLVPPVCIGRNCRIKGGARIGPYTVLGDNTFVEEEAVVERSVVWDNVYIGHNVGVHSAIVCSRATVKRDSVLREDSVIGDRCLIDVGCTIRPRIKIWPDKIIERGSTVTMSLVWGNKWRGNLFRELGVAGLSNIEITPDFACRLAAAFGSSMPPGTKVVTSRDSTRSSRMIKRAVISSLLSAGCDVLDLRSMALPISRHYIRTAGAGGAINIRKLPGNTRVTLIEFMDARGAYLNKSAERKIETAFFREDYRRTDPDNLGQIEFASRAVEEYQSDFFRLLGPSGNQRRKLKIAVDYGFSSLAAYFPAMLAELGVESIALNGYSDAKRSPRNADDVRAHVTNLKTIVGTLGYDMGVLLMEEGERLALVDNRGDVIEGTMLLATMATLVCQTKPGAKVALSVTAPTKLEEHLVALGATVIRTKADVRSLISDGVDAEVDLAGDGSGGFAFPALTAGFDAPFSIGTLISTLQKSGQTLSEVIESLPPFRVAYESIRVDWESKGGVMRQLAEESHSAARVELVDGIKIFIDDNWVLVLPDAIEPLFHIYAESGSDEQSRMLASEYAKKIGDFQTQEPR